MKLLEVDIDYVSAEAIICMKNLLRKYPNVSDRIINGLGAFLKSVEEPEAKAALLWMISEYGHVRRSQDHATAFHCFDSLSRLVASSSPSPPVRRSSLRART